MRSRGRKRAWVALWALAGGTGGQEGRASSGVWRALWNAQGGAYGVRAQSTDAAVGRWAQSSALLTPSDDPTLLVVSGKTAVAGQTITSTPSTSSAISLSLSEPILNLASPPWTDLSSTGPISAYGSLVPLSSSSALFFGGDATGDPTESVQTANDSSWLLALSSTSASSSTSSLTATWAHQAASSWPSQPQRRENAYTASATNGTLSRVWIYGGVRADGSGTAFSELWELQVPVSSADGFASASQAQWAGGAGKGGPPAMYDGTAVLVPSSTSGAQPSIYLVGGVQILNGVESVVSLSSVWVYTPTDALAGGSWSQVSASNAPTGRRGHVAVDVGNGKIWIQGGRSADGTQVMSDGAVLDTKKGSWTTTSEGEQVWGHAAAMVGETVVLAYGYGLNAPASTALSVYSPSNDTWLTAYYPSFIAIVSNPKASGSSSSGSSASSSLDWTAISTFSASVASASPSSATSSASASSGSDSSNGGSGSSDSTTLPQWTAPGAAGTTTPSSSNPSGDNSSGGDNSSSASGSGSGTPSKSLIAGAVVGSLLGALALVVAGGYAVKRTRDNHRRYGSSFASGRYTGDGPDGGGLMAEHRTAGGYASSETYNSEKALPVAPMSLGRAGGGVRGAFAALLGSPREHVRPSGRKRRFDMLQDEGNDVWDAEMGKEGWTRFEDDEALEEGRSPSLRGRGGMAIWEGFGGMAAGAGRLGDSLKSSRSYLGGALGGFIGLAGDDRTEEADTRRDHHHAYADLPRPDHTYADPALTPIAEWEEDDVRSDTDDMHTLESAQTRSSGTHRTASTLPTSREDSPTKASRIVRPFSPSSSLYGSTFAAQQAFPITRSSSAGSGFLHRHNSSWWSRLNLAKPLAGDIPTPTALEAIRDPAPAPSLAAIVESDPFVDSLSDATHRRARSITRPDEHGRLDDKALHHSKREHDRSLSSNVSGVTATSSVLEERMRDMDVVQRMRTGSGGVSSTEVTPTMGGTDSGTFGHLPEASDPFADSNTPAQGSVVWAGSQAATPALPHRAATPPPPVPPVPSILPPTPSRIAPESPRRTRLIGPRPQPSSPLPSSPFAIPRSSSVKDLVANIERRSSVTSLPSSSPILTPPSPVKRRQKVEHGLAKRQQLYVANPDNE
ncbi:hypothetical protein JCM1840_002409 [Sporobolomyces johnsonii]